MNLLADSIQGALRSVGLKEGDVILIHSDLGPFLTPGLIQKKREDMLQFFLDCFLNVLGKAGTLAVPAFFYEYARYGEPFDVERSPVSVELGVFSRYVASLPGRIRSASPLQSLAAIGAKANDLVGGDSLSGYGITSPWHKLRMLNGKIVFFGASFLSMTYAHYIEHLYGVPHRYCKAYPFPVLRNGVPIAGVPTSTVRFLEFDVLYDIAPFQKCLEERGMVRSAKVGTAEILSVYAEEVFQVGIELLDKNPYFFLKHPPAFIPGKIPCDGMTGSLL